MKNKIVFVKSGITGGHFAFQTDKAKTPFTNKLTEAMMVPILPSDIVVDIGGYIGEYSLYAKRQGAKKVTVYEPTPDTFKLLSKNVNKLGIIAVNKAVVGDKTIKNIELFISSGIGVTNSIAKKDRKARSTIVPAIHYDKAVKGATIVKIDVEGAEYSYHIVQPTLRAIILEFHPITGVDWQANARKIIKDIKAAGFKSLCEPGFTNGWDMHGA